MKSRNVIILDIAAVFILFLFAGIFLYWNNKQEEANQRSRISEGNAIATPDKDPSDDLPIASEPPRESDDGITDTAVDGDDHASSGDQASEASTETSQEATAAPTSEIDREEPITLTFVGDINLDENSKPVKKYDKEQKDIYGGISEELIQEMTEADVCMLNNEFAYSTRGEKEPEKSYTFRAKPERVNILKEMGVDIVSLANNHSLDYGVDALLDTFDTLDNAGIDYVGAGDTIDRAKQPIYYTIKDTRIAFLAASRVIYEVDWYATETRPGMIGTYDPSLFIECIEEAAANSDYVVVYVHWGVELQDYPENYQKSFARAYIDAGADIVVGSHPHVMQGFEIYNGKPIAYSLGNFWFNSFHRETGLFKVILNPDGTIESQFLPAIQDNTYTYPMEDDDLRADYLKYLEDISFQVDISDEGFIKGTDTVE